SSQRCSRHSNCRAGPASTRDIDRAWRVAWTASDRDGQAEVTAVCNTAENDTATTRSTASSELKWFRLVRCRLAPKLRQRSTGGAGAVALITPVWGEDRREVRDREDRAGGDTGATEEEQRHNGQRGKSDRAPPP